MSEGDDPGLRMCCCTDAVVAPGLGNDAEMFFGPLALWQIEEEGKNSAESLPRERALVAPWSTSRKVWLSVLFLPRSFPQTCQFACISLSLKKRRLES